MKNGSKLIAVVLLTLGLWPAAGVARDGSELTADHFAQLRQQIRPQPGESLWEQLPWQIDLHAARQMAATQGKPLFVMSGGGATAIGAC